MASGEPGGSVKSALRTLEVLELVVDQARPMAANEIASLLGIPISSLSYLLATLVERGYLERSRRLYAAGPALERLRPRLAAPTLAERAEPIVRMISREINETTSFFVRRGFEIEAVATETGHHALKFAVDVGARAPLHSYAAGKALLAFLPEGELDSYFSTVERAAFTPRTIVAEDALRSEIEHIRTGGISRASEEHVAGVIGIGRPALIDDVPVGAFSIAIPAGRYDEDVDALAVRLLFKATERLAAAGHGDGLQPSPRP